MAILDSRTKLGALCRFLHWQPASYAVFWIIAAAIANADAQVRATEDQVKVAYLFNFAKFVEWPAEAFSSADSPMNFCALGNSGVIDEMQSVINGKTVNGHVVRVTHVTRPAEVKDCHLIFVKVGSQKAQQELLQAAKGSPVLVVGDIPGFVRAGGMIGLFTEAGSVLFEINPRAAEESHLRISSKLLALARIVH